MNSLKNTYDNPEIFDIEQPDLLSNIEHLESFCLTFHFFNADILNTVKQIVEIILTRTNHEELHGMLYSGLKEVIINGAKANVKRIVYEKNNLDLDNEADKDEGVRLLKDFLVNHSSAKLSEILRESGYSLKLCFFTNTHGLRIEVTNNARLSKVEDSIIRKKFQDSQKHDDILQFLTAQEGVVEGAGLGIFMFVLMLKKYGINPDHFRIGRNKNGDTFARIEVPYDEHFESVRKMKSDNKKNTSS